MKEDQLVKSDLEECAKIFKTDILQNKNRISLLKELGSKNNFQSKKSLRPIAWKLFLETIPSSSKDDNNIIKDWVDTILIQREEYKKKLKKYCSLKKIGTIDPLLKADNKKRIDLLYTEEEKSVLELIQLDVKRTRQSLDLFQTTKTENILSNVLYIYSKKYWGNMPYISGMNELVSMIYICLYPYYFSTKEKINKEKIYEYLNDINKYYKEIYLFFHDEDQIQSDMFYLFESLQIKGINDMYNITDIKPNEPNYHLYELFPNIIIDILDEKRTNRTSHLYLRANAIINEKLKLIDERLFYHLKKIDIDCNLSLLLRWIRIIFAMEFNFNHVFILWDKIFFHQFNSDKKYKYPFIYIDFICIAILVNIRYKILSKKNYDDFYTMIFYYPLDNDISNILLLSEKIAEIIEKKINGENYDVNEILKLVKNNENYNEIDI